MTVPVVSEEADAEVVVWFVYFPHHGFVCDGNEGTSLILHRGEFSQGAAEELSTCERKVWVAVTGTATGGAPLTLSLRREFQILICL